jgi:hypothetical protein
MSLPDISAAHEGVLDNIREWKAGREKLDVRCLCDALDEIYGPDLLTNWVAYMLLDLAEASHVET